jgi:hypothetical protein
MPKKMNDLIYYLYCGKAMALKRLKRKSEPFFICNLQNEESMINVFVKEGDDNKYKLPFEKVKKNLGASEFSIETYTKGIKLDMFNKDFYDRISY